MGKSLPFFYGVTPERRRRAAFFFLESHQGEPSRKQHLSQGVTPRAGRG